MPALCVLLAMVFGVSRPAAGAGDGPQSPGGQVAALYEKAARAAAQYEVGRKAAAGQKTRALELERRLGKQRQRLRLLHEDVGRLARAQYRAHDDGLSVVANALLADSPEQLLDNAGLASRGDLAVTHLVERAERAADKLSGDEKRAKASWRALEKRSGELAVLKQGIDRKLKSAQRTLQAQADVSVAAGQCRGAVRLAQPAVALPKGPWVKPVQRYVLSAGFGGSGERWSHRHTGQDFAVDIGTPVRSVGAGRVVRVSCGGAFGIEVVVKHPGGYYTQYAHLSAPAVDQGEKVRAGQWIGQSGTTGNSTGPHLHFEVRLTPDYGSAVSPVPWLKEHGVRV